jgi:hypothetical protein
LRVLTNAFSGNSEIVIGPAAERARLGVAPQESVTMVYVLAHGTRDAGRERPSGLLLARSSSSREDVWAEDIEAMHSASLVFLTVCEAGRAPMRRGDGGRSDLAAAFLYAGASTVVLPTCDLELDATLRVVPRILRSLSAGEETAEVLRAVRAELVVEHDSRAALQAHLLHVVGRGGTRLPASERSQHGSFVAGALWMLVPGGIVLALWVVHIASKKRASRAALPHGSRPN